MNPRAAGVAAALCAALLTAASSAAAAGPLGGLDARGWELVSPVDKNGAQVGAPGAEAAGVGRAAAGGGALAYGSASSFGEAAGSLPVNQYLARRSAGGWVSENLTPPALSGTYEGGAYERFSEQLAAAVLADGWACRDGALLCPAEGPALGPGGLPGYRNLYLREGATHTPLITAANSPLLTVAAEDFRLALTGASPDLRHLVISTCAALVAGASEVPGPQGCDPAAQNLYQWSEGTLAALNFLPGETQTTPGATLPTGPGAVSADGSRVYWTAGGNLYLREAGESALLAEGASFQAASRDGSLAFFLKAGHLYRYSVAGKTIADLTPSGAVVASIGVSEDGATLYYVTANGLYRLDHGLATKLATASPAQLPPAIGSARTSADGTRLFFDTSRSLLFADTNASADVYEWEAQGTGSCTRVGGCLGLISDGRSAGASLIDASASGEDVFFATATALLPRDPDGALDVYDAREGGGFPEPPPPACVGDDCPDPATAGLFEVPPTATLPGRANPPVRFAKEGRKPKKKHKPKQRKKRHRDGHGKHRHHHRAAFS